MKILACMLMFMLLFCGCDAEDGKVTGTTEGTSTTAAEGIVTGTTGSTSRTSAAASSSSAASRTSATTTDAPLFDRTAYFAKDEISHIFDNTMDSLEKLFGKVTEDKEITEGNTAYRRMTYGDNIFETDKEGKRIYRATIADDRIEAFRGIRIGDSPEEVLAKLPEAKNDDRTALTGEGEKGEYNLLYGDYRNESDYGIVVYGEDDKISEIRLTESQYGATVYFENEKVSKIEYYSPR